MCDMPLFIFIYRLCLTSFHCLQLDNTFFEPKNPDFCCESWFWPLPQSQGEFSPIEDEEQDSSKVIPNFRNQCPRCEELNNQKMKKYQKREAKKRKFISAKNIQLKLSPYLQDVSMDPI
jgi:hypothetical protein